MIRIEPAASLPPTLRTHYLDSLPFAQEFYLEGLVRSGRTFLISDTGGVMGYAVLHGETIVEFYIPAGVPGGAAAVFDGVLEFHRAKAVLCKSFDAVLMEVAGRRAARTQTTGFLFRDFTETGTAADPAVEIRRGTAADIGLILAVNDGFFSGADEVRRYLDQDGCFVYLSRDGSLIGCGILAVIVPGRPDADIGMFVTPRFRGQGHGARIIRHLRDYCLTRGLNPVCGCEAGNAASRKALEKAGFISNHRLIKFEF